jgi:hypothetical protein
MFARERGREETKDIGPEEQGLWREEQLVTHEEGQENKWDDIIERILRTWQV